jgi:hypothetical protein
MFTAQIAVGFYDFDTLSALSDIIDMPVECVAVTWPGTDTDKLRYGKGELHF